MMNTPIHFNELDPAEQKRRAAAKARAERICRKLGFRQVAGKPGYWWHEDIGETFTFPLSADPVPMETPGDVLATIFWHGMERGRREIRAAFKELMEV